MLELQNICYRVSTPEGELDILRDISITIPDQRLMVFTGPNGGGKTTLAKIIMGLVQPTSAAFCITARTSPRCPSPTGQGWASATAFSSRPGSRGSRSTICCGWRRGRKSSPRTSAAPI